MESETVEKDFQTVTDEYGRGVARGLAEEVAAVNHAASCDGTDENDDPCKVGEGSEDPEAWHDEERARRRIEESPLSVEVRSGWYSPGGEPGKPEEFCILLGTGGPASRIVGQLSEYGEPGSASFEFQDWFKPWTAANLTSDEESTLLAWAQIFYFGG